MKKLQSSLRGFNADNDDERRRFAKEFVEEFVKDVAPPKRLDSSNAEWTTRVRCRFNETCPEDCDAVPNKSKGWKEYLVDFCWMEKKGLGGRVVVACESEWAADRWGSQTRWTFVEEDFEKLLAVKAPLKILIFSSTSESIRTSKDQEVDFPFSYAKERLEASLRGYSHHLPGETYLLLDFPATGDKDGEGVYDAHVWVSDGSEKPNVNFGPLAHGDLNRPA